MKKFKLFASIGIMVASISLSLGVTSCGGLGTGDVDQFLPTDDPTSTQTIEFWHCLGQKNEENLSRIVDAFNTGYTGKYQVVLKKLSGGYDELHDTIITRLASNQVPAIAMGYPDSFSEYMTDDIRFSYLLRLDNFIKDPEFGYSAAEIADFIDEYYAEGSNYQYEGTWSMPMYKSTEIMYYNANYFAGDNDQSINHFTNDTTYINLRNAVINGGASASDDDLNALREYCEANGGYTYEVPTTWDEMVETGRQINKDRKAENVTGVFTPIGYDSDSNMFISQFEQRGIAYTTNDATGDDKILFNNDEAKAFASEVVGLIQEGVMVTKNSLGGNTYTNTYFTNNQSCMTIGSTGGSSYNVSSNFTVKLAPVPYANDNPKYIMQGPSICFFNNDNDYIHKGAWLFYKYMADPQRNCELALQNSYDPIRKSSYETEQYKTWVSRAGKGNLNYDIPAATQTIRENYMTSPVFIGSSTCRDEIGNIITYMVRSGYSVDRAFEAAENAAKTAVL